MADSTEGSGRPALKRVYQGFAVAGVILGTLLGATSLVDWFAKLGDTGEPPPARRIETRLLSAELRGSAETLDEYVRETKPAGSHFTAEQLREVGYRFVVEVLIRGARDRQFPLRWSLREAGSGRRVEGSAYDQLAAKFVPLGEEHSTTYPVWAPQPPARGRYFLRFVLFDPEGRPVDTRDSPPFEHAGGGR